MLPKALVIVLKIMTAEFHAKCESPAGFRDQDAIELLRQALDGLKGMRIAGQKIQHLCGLQREAHKTHLTYWTL